MSSTKSAAILWTCELTDTENLTVGSKFHLKCSGNLKVPFGNSLKAELPEGNRPETLKILNAVQVSDQSVDLVVTSYLPGEHNLKYVRITDGVSAVESGELKWSVTSVLAQDSKPFPPLGPMGLGFPELILWTGVILLALLGALAARVFFKRRQKNHLLKDLSDHESAFDPKTQFEKDLRKIRRSMNWKDSLTTEDLKGKMESLDLALRVFLMRTYQVRTFGQSSKALFHLVKAHCPQNDLRNWSALLKELERPQKQDAEALIQLTDLAQKMVVKL